MIDGVMLSPKKVKKDMNKTLLEELIVSGEEIGRLKKEIRTRDLMIQTLNNEIEELNKEYNQKDLHDMQYYKDQLTIKNMLIEKLEKDLEVL